MKERKMRPERKISWFVTGLTALLLMIAALLGVSVYRELTEQGIIPQTEEELAVTKTEYLASQFWKTRKYRQQVVINEEKGYIAVESGDTYLEEGGWKITDRNGNLLCDLRPYGIDMVYSGTVKGKYASATTADMDTDFLIDRETLEVINTGGSFVGLDPDGRYYLVHDEDDPQRDQREVRTPDGKILLRTKDVLGMTTEKSYVIENPGAAGYEGESRLIRLDTGKTVYTAPKDCQILDRAQGYTALWVSGKTEQGISCMYGVLLDENFQLALNGRRFYNVGFTERYIYGSVYPDGEAVCSEDEAGGVAGDTKNGSSEDLPEESEYPRYYSVVYTLDGQLVYTGETGDYFYGVYGDLAVILRTALVHDGHQKYWKHWYVYVDLKERRTSDEAGRVY